MTHFSFHSSFKETSIECDRQKSDGALWHVPGDPTPVTSLLTADLIHVSFLPKLEEGRTWQTLASSEPAGAFCEAEMAFSV